jgi:hypothetical protein
VALEPRSSLGTMMSRRSNTGRRKEANAGQGVREESLSPPQGWRAASRRAGGEDDGGDRVLDADTHQLHRVVPSDARQPPGSCWRPSNMVLTTTTMIGLHWPHSSALCRAVCMHRLRSKNQLSMRGS